MTACWFVPAYCAALGSLAFPLLYPPWCAVWWRLRGGALTALTGWDPGTGGMRAIAAGAMTAPLLLLGWVWVFLIPALWLGWAVAGWGAFQGMGASPVEMKNPVARFLARFLSGVWLCLVGMAIEGFYALLGADVVIALISDVRLFALIGLGFAPLYWLAQKSPWRPDAGRFARGGSEWAEVLVGGWFGLALALLLRQRS